MCYDLIVLVLSIVKLSRQSCKSPLKDRLRAQGLLYFAVATMANIPPIVCTPHASFIIIYSSLLSTGLFFPWSQRYDHSLLVGSIIQLTTGMAGITGTFGKPMVRGGVCMI
jgi:hypothetical protein